jgi:hypothetical protein
LAYCPSRVGAHGPAARPAIRGDQAKQEDHGLAHEKEQHQQDDQQRGTEPGRRGHDHAERRDDEEHDQEHDLRPETTQTGAALGIERCTLVIGQWWVSRGVAGRSWWSGGLV